MWLTLLLRIKKMMKSQRRLMLQTTLKEAVTVVTLLNVLSHRAVLALLLTLSVLSSANAALWQNISTPLFHRPISTSSDIQGPIVSTAEDKSGFMWFVTANGLWRWDSHFSKKAQFASLGDTQPVPVIHGLITDTKNRIWVGTSQGLFQLDTDRLLLNPVDGVEQLANESIQKGVYASHSNKEWLILASDRQIYQYDIVTKVLSDVVMPESMRVYALSVGQNKTLWVGAEKGLFSAPLKQSNIELKPSQSFVANKRITAITTLASGKMLIGTAKNGIFISDTANSFNPITLQNDAESAWVYNLLEIEPDKVLVGTFGHGLITLDLKTQKQRRFQSNKLHPLGLADNNIWNTYKDSRNLTWIGAGESVNLLEHGSKGITHILGGLGLDKHLPESKVHALISYKNNLVLANGTYGLISLSPTQGILNAWWTHSRDPIETLFSDRDGNLYASSNFATVELPTDTRKAESLSIGSRPQDSFTSAFAQSDKALWVGGTDGLWMRPSTTTGPAQHLNLTELKDRRISALFADKHRLWIGTWQGLYLASLDENSGAISQITPASNATLQQQFITDIYVDTAGKVWAGTSNAGLFIGDSNNEVWRQRNGQHNMPSNTVAGIAGEHSDKVWASTARGIIAVDVSGLSVRQVVAPMQSINSPFSRASAAITEDGSVAFGGRNGITLLSPETLSRAEAPLTLSFTDIFAITKDDRKIQKPGGSELLTFSSLPKRIAFEFVALDYLSPQDIHYRYRILGQEDNWTVLDANHRSITITSPDPGHYELQVEYALDGKQWHSNTLTQNFFVHPAWYQTSFFKFGGAVLLLLSVLGLHQLSLRHYRSRQRRLEENVAQRTAELTAANVQLQEQASALERASLTDALTGANNRRFLLQNISTDIATVCKHYETRKSKAHQSTERLAEEKHDLLFIIIDLDHFKQINDTYGHHVGDQVLIETKTRLSNQLNKDDYLIRWGGEEFLAVIHNQSRYDAHKIAERLVSCMSVSPFYINDETSLSVSCSVGFASYPMHSEHHTFFDWHSTVAAADAALYKSKGRGRDTWTGIVNIHQAASEQTLALIKQYPARVFDSAETVIRP